MVVRQKTRGTVTALHRRIMRQIPLWLLKDGYEQLVLGRGESLVCMVLKIDLKVFGGVLRPAIEEALWERGALR